MPGITSTQELEAKNASSLITYDKKATDYVTVELTHNWESIHNGRAPLTAADPHTVINASLRTHKKKTEVPVIADSSDKDLVIHAIMELEDAFGSSRLNLTPVTCGGDAGLEAAKKNLLRRILQGDALTIFERRKNSTDVAIRDESYNDRVGNVISEIFKGERAWQGQLTYMNRVTKPFKLSVDELLNRIYAIDRLTKKLPGNPDVTKTMFSTDLAIKQIFHSMMLPAWKVALEKAGHDIYQDTYTISQLSRFMRTQETYHNASGQKVHKVGKQRKKQHEQRRFSPYKNDFKQSNGNGGRGNGKPHGGPRGRGPGRRGGGGRRVRSHSPRRSDRLSGNPPSTRAFSPSRSPTRAARASGGSASAPSTPAPETTAYVHDLYHVDDQQQDHGYDEGYDEYQEYEEYQDAPEDEMYYAEEQEQDDYYEEDGYYGEDYGHHE